MCFVRNSLNNYLWDEIKVDQQSVLNGANQDVLTCNSKFTY